MGRRAVKRWWVRVGEGRRRRAWLARNPGRPVDVVVSHAEVNDRHGTGVFTKRLFGGAPDLVSVRSHDDYDARQDFGVWSVRIPQPDPSPAAALRRVRAVFRGAPVRRVVAIPYRPDDVRTALALLDAGASGVCTYILDDQNVEVSRIPDAPLAELLSRSALRLAESEELCGAYERKFGLPVALVPPVIDPALIPPAPVPTPHDALRRPRGVMIGNVWGQRWLTLLCDVVRGSGVEIDWYTNTGLRWHVVDAAALASAGVHLKVGLPEPALIDVLRRSAFCVLPSGTLDEGDDNRAIAHLSLPSKLVYTAMSAHLPTLVLGHPDTAAARFVVRQRLGKAIPYEREAFTAAVAELVRPEVQEALRARAAELAPLFSAEGAGDWIWRSLSAGKPLDDRWGKLVRGPRSS